jgi:hypothetical protein
MQTRRMWIQLSLSRRSSVREGIPPSDVARSGKKEPQIMTRSAALRRKIFGVLRVSKLLWAVSGGILVGPLMSNTYLIFERLPSSHVHDHEQGSFELGTVFRRTRHCRGAIICRIRTLLNLNERDPSTIKLVRHEAIRAPAPAERRPGPVRMTRIRSMRTEHESLGFQTRLFSESLGGSEQLA